MTNESQKTTKKEPLVYIIMPCYNWEKYLLEQLMSIYYQNYSNWYLIFVNDWSTDNSENILRDWISHYDLHKKVKVITKENWGVNSAVQRWLEEIKDICNIHDTDSLISYCDCDDVWTREKLEEQVNYMIDHPECDLSYHDMVKVNKNWVFEEISACKMDKLLLNRENFFYIWIIWSYITSNEIIFRAKYIDLIIPLPLWFWMYQDYRSVLIFTLNELKIHFINKPLSYYRNHQSLSKTETNWKKEINLKYFYYLQTRFPKKDIKYVIKYNEDRYINRENKNKIQLLTLILLKYPKAFLLLLKGRVKEKLNINF